MYYLWDGFSGPHRWIDSYPDMKGLFWTTGRRFSEEIAEPLEIILEPLSDDYDPDDPDSEEGPDMPDCFLDEIPLLTNALIEALARGGVDNLDTYDAVLIDPETDERHDSYKAVNIIGLIAAADMDASNATVHPGGPVIDVDFDGLVVDESKAGGQLLFRLAESVNGILIHEELKDHLLSEGFDRLVFLETGDVAL